MAFSQTAEGELETAGWFIAPLAGASPLAIPYDIETDYTNLHWSPAGDPFTKNLRKLCPDATRDTDECDTGIGFWGTVAAIHWIDGNRVLFLTRDPSVLFLGKMDFTGNGWHDDTHRHLAGRRMGRSKEFHHSQGKSMIERRRNDYLPKDYAMSSSDDIDKNI